MRRSGRGRTALLGLAALLALVADSEKIEPDEPPVIKLPTPAPRPDPAPQPAPPPPDPPPAPPAPK